MEQHIRKLASMILERATDATDARRRFSVVHSPSLPDGISYVSSPEVVFEGRVRSVRFVCENGTSRRGNLTIAVTVEADSFPLVRWFPDRGLCGR